MNLKCILHDTLSRFTSITAIPTQTPRITPQFLRNQSSTLDTQPWTQRMERNKKNRTTGEKKKSEKRYAGFGNDPEQMELSKDNIRRDRQNKPNSN